MTFMAVSANLGPNDTIYTSGPRSFFTINETVVRAYPDSVRETNHLNTTFEYSWTVNETQCYERDDAIFYWDRSTGILVEDIFGGINRTGDYLTTWSSLTRITESNVWAIPEFPTWASALILFVILTSTIVVYKRKARAPSNLVLSH